MDQYSHLNSEMAKQDGKESPQSPIPSNNSSLQDNTDEIEIIQNED